LPTVEQWQGLKAILLLGDEMDDEFARLAGRKFERGDAWNDAEIIGEHSGATPGFGDHRFTARDSLIRQPTDAARAWEGWGTALKPALEPLCIARKPLDGTVAGNVLAHGTGALNIDACRVAGPPRTTHADGDHRQKLTSKGTTGGAWGNQDADLGASTLVYAARDGRWPANVAHDGSAEVVDVFPNRDVNANSGRRNGDKFRSVYGEFKGAPVGSKGETSDGSAARFFYSAKADAADRLASKHPTVKPVDLVQWLVRLVTPPGGTVLDPFAGSGTTAMACMAEGFDCIVVEREAEYVADIRRRVAHVHGTDTPLFGGGK
jgi:hypothetical protein